MLNRVSGSGFLAVALSCTLMALSTMRFKKPLIANMIPKLDTSKKQKQTCSIPQWLSKQEIIKEIK